MGLHCFGFLGSSPERLRAYNRPGLCGKMSSVMSGLLQNADTFNVIPTMIASCIAEESDKTGVLNLQLQNGEASGDGGQ